MRPLCNFKIAFICWVLLIGRSSSFNGINMVTKSSQLAALVHWLGIRYDDLVTLIFDLLIVQVLPMGCFTGKTTLPKFENGKPVRLAVMVHFVAGLYEVVWPWCLPFWPWNGTSLVGCSCCAGCEWSVVVGCTNNWSGRRSSRSSWQSRMTTTSWLPFGVWLPRISLQCSPTQRQNFTASTCKSLAIRHMHFCQSIPCGLSGVHV